MEKRYLDRLSSFQVFQELRKRPIAVLQRQCFYREILFKRASGKSLQTLRPEWLWVNGSQDCIPFGRVKQSGLEAYKAIHLHLGKQAVGELLHR